MSMLEPTHDSFRKQMLTTCSTEEQVTVTSKCNWASLQAKQTQATAETAQVNEVKRSTID
jgi:hypothetical protein